jgi:hypothetical protein
LTLLHVRREHSSPSVTDRCRGKRGDKRPYAGFSAIASAIAKRELVRSVTTNPGRPHLRARKEIANQAERAHGPLMHEESAGAGQPAKGGRA